jgi:hypothetical protein
VNEINIVLKAGLIYSLRFNGKSIKLHAGDGILSDLTFNVFIINKLISEAIKIPPK